MNKLWQAYRDGWVMRSTQNGLVTEDTLLGNGLALAMAVELGLLCWILW